MFFFKLQGRQKEEVRGVPDFLQRLELHRSVCVGGVSARSLDSHAPCPSPSYVSLSYFSSPMLSLYLCKTGRATWPFVNNKCKNLENGPENFRQHKNL